MGVTKTQYDVLSQEFSKHGATIKTRWRSFTSSQRAQCLEAVNGIKNPKHWKKNPCGDVFFHIAGVSLRDIISNPEVLLSLLKCQVAGTFGGQVSQVHAAGNRRSKFGQNTLFNNPDEAHGADEEFLNCSRGINLPGSELACEGIARSPCAVKFTAPHNQMHMLKFLNETIAQLLKYYPGTEQKEEEQIEEVLSSDITRLHIKGVPTPGRPESKEKHNDHALPKTVNFVTAEVFWTTMGKDRARTRGRSTDGDTLNKWMVLGKQTLGQNIKVELEKKQEMIPVDLIPWLDANQYIWARGGVAFPGQTKALVRHPGVKVDFQRFVKPVKPEEQAKINQEMQELVESFHNLEPGEPEFDLQEEIERRAKKYGCYQVAMTYPKRDEISDEKEVGTEGK